MNETRHLGFWGAVGVGVGAIVGGGILALAGVAFATTGPAAILAFGLNGIIALLTALSFGEMAAAFPQSGGTYNFAKKILSVRAAFAVGWIVWFASIVAAVLYALGFAAFAMIAFQELWQAEFGTLPGWLTSRWMNTSLAITAALIYTSSLVRQTGGGNQWANIGKVFVFGVLIVGGAWAFTKQTPGLVGQKLDPFFPFGSLGLIQAMGYTFIALQGFDLIAAVGGEVKNPGRNIPRAMLVSLGIALLIYIPLLFIVTTVGMTPGQSVVEISQQNPEIIVAVAASTYLGRFGYWLVIVAGILSMLSALQANLFAASRVAMAMGRDRTLPRWLETIHPYYQTPVKAVFLTTLIVIILLLILPDVAAAGAASSLIFLITFALAHLICILLRKRSAGIEIEFRTPFFPIIPVVGGLACMALAIFQGLTVLAAGVITGLWLLAGAGLYFAWFAHRAKVVDAAEEAYNPTLVQLRGRSPLVLVPIANPASAAAMVFLANALAPPSTGRVLLLTVVGYHKDLSLDVYEQKISDAQTILRQSLRTSLESRLFPEAMTTIAADPWQEIIRIAAIHRCQSLLLGLTSLSESSVNNRLEELISRVGSDVVVLKAPSGWRLDRVQRILVPIGGRGGHDALRARILGSLGRTTPREVTYLQVVPSGSTPQFCARTQRKLALLSWEETPGEPHPAVIGSDNPLEEVIRQAQSADLVILGLPQVEGRRVFGDFSLRIAKETKCAVLMISHQMG